MSPVGEQVVTIFSMLMTYSIKFLGKLSLKETDTSTEDAETKLTGGSTDSIDWYLFFTLANSIGKMQNSS